MITRPAVSPLFLITLVYMVGLLAAGVLAQDSDPGIDPIVQIQTEANQAYATGDWDTFLAMQKELLEHQPDNPVVAYNTACGYALTGDKESAIEILAGLTARGIDFGAATDPDFRSLADLPEFDQLMAQLDSLYPPINTSEIVYDLDPPDLIHEGMAYDPRTGRLFIGSMRYGNIHVAGPNHSLTEFARIDGGGPLGILGLEVDTIRNILWAAGTAFQATEGYLPADRGITAVFGFDLDNGTQSLSFRFPGRHPGFGFNDLTVSSAGDIYCTGGPVYVFPAGSIKPELLLPTDVVSASNGITLSDDEKTLFIAAGGIVRVDLENGEYNWLEHADSIRVGNVDGMYYYDGSLVGIQHGPAPWRAARWFLNANETAIDSVITLERKTSGVFTATTGALVGDEFYFLARTVPPTTLPGGIPEGLRLFMGRPMIWKTSLTDRSVSQR
ncbi:hypothetical protein GF377_10010 [candidate division GN15 bacterium]|nr:hypothetical protein [candidate division GN15 bacterium]